ncbi:MAG: GTPase (G3E family) [Clostridia bacterium]|nr:GTPase (G3E family) [Clostridia bacterium]
MIKIDLITGFLGSGKTTFIKKYAEYLLKKGEKIGILENDFGAVNVDMMLLQNLQGDNCNLETVAGACDADCHKRRFKTKLIAMAMSGCDRVIVEPSGIFDTDEFFDTLREEPLDRWYESANVIAIVNSELENDLSEHSKYLLTSQIANAGKIIFSRVQETSQTEIEKTKTSLEQLSHRKLENIIIKDWKELSENDFEEISQCGYVKADFIKKFSENENYSSLYFMNSKISVEELKKKSPEIFGNKDLGNVFRIKGFILENSRWFEINATRKNITVSPITNGQEIIIIIGENLDKKKIQSVLQ